MKRIAVLTLAAVLLIVIGVGVASWLSSGNVPSTTLASATVETGGQRVEFRIYEQSGNVFAEATVPPNGWLKVLKLGETAEIGTGAPAIVREPANMRVVLRVGKATAYFEEQTKVFWIPKIA